MADVLTSQSATFAKTIWQQALEWPYHDELHFVDVAKKQPTTERGFRGKEVTITYINDLAVATTAIDEVLGPDAVTFTTSTQTITLAEYANTMITTALARTTEFIDLDETCVNLLGFNAGSTVDTLAATALVAGTQIQYANGRANDAAITATDVLTTAELEIAATELEAQNVPKINGYYVLYAHPYQIHDLRLQTGAGGFRQLRENSGVNSSELINHTVGEWAGFRIVSANRSPMAADDGSGNVDIYKAIAVGAEGFGMAYSDHPESPGATPEIRFGLRTDHLKRNQPISWYALLGFKVLRQAGVRKIHTASSRGANA